MELEVKLRLPNAAAHQKVLSIFSPFHSQTLYQVNVFYDGAAGELSSHNASLCLRFVKNHKAPKCFVCLKAGATIVEGVSQVRQETEDVDFEAGRRCWKDPKVLEEVNFRLVRKATEEFGIQKLGDLGAYRNVRNVFHWNGMKLEVDETLYDFGTCYEIECETTNPEAVKNMIEGFLKYNGIEFSYSKMSKFATFQSGKLPV